MRRKRTTLRSYARVHGLRVFVETGTYLGDTASALRSDFDRIVTIELDPVLARWAAGRFHHDPHITVLRGDSGELLPDVLAGLREPALFWLDGHYSGPGTAYGDSPTPVLRELSSIVAHPVDGHVVLIDDARCFGHDTGYPSLDEIEAVAKRRAAWNMTVLEDAIRLAPRASHI
jgi:hypothetical protein